MTQPRYIGPLYVLSAIFLWSSLGVVIRKAGVPVQYLIFYSNLLSSVLMGLYLLATRAPMPSRKDTAKLLLLGPLTLINSFTFYWGLAHTTVAKALMAHYIAPVVVAVLAWALLKEPLTARTGLAIAMSSVGLWVLLGLGGQGGIGELLGRRDDDALGVLMAAISGVAYAFVVVTVRVFAQAHDPFVLTFLQNIFMWALLLPFIDGFPADAAWSFVLVAVVHSTIAPILYFKGLRTVRATQAAILGYLEPLSGAAFAMIFLAEYPAASAITGGALIILSGYLVIKE